MSRKGAPKLRRLSDVEVLTLLATGVYKVCPRTAEVTGYNGRRVEPWVIKGRAFVRVYGFGGCKMLALARLVWMSVTGEVPPAGFEVHHRNEDKSDDSWDNLIALHKLDHRKCHVDQEETIPF